MTKKYTIMVDLDSVLNDLCDYWLKEYNKRYKTNFELEQVTDWNWEKCLGVGHEIYTLLDEPHFFENCPPIQPAIDCMKKLQDDGHTIIIVTACDNDPHVFAEKAAWIEKYLPFLPHKNKLIGGNWKDLINADIFIDDSPTNVIKYREKHPNSIIITLDYAYNRQVPLGVCNRRGVSYPPYKWDGIWEGIYYFIKNLGTCAWCQRENGLHHEFCQKPKYEIHSGSEYWTVKLNAYQRNNLLRLFETIWIHPLGLTNGDWSGEIPNMLARQDANGILLMRPYNDLLDKDNPRDYANASREDILNTMNSVLKKKD